jgi:DNA repair protein RadC
MDAADLLRPGFASFLDVSGRSWSREVILGHNHPSGVSEPSEADRSITLKLAKALALVEIRLLDHVVVSRGGHVSLAERGWL